PISIHRRCAPCGVLSSPTAVAQRYALSLHDALPILELLRLAVGADDGDERENSHTAAHEGDFLFAVLDIKPIAQRQQDGELFAQDRKSTRLNSSHVSISYAVFCLKKKNKQPPTPPTQ